MHDGIMRGVGLAIEMKKMGVPFTSILDVGGTCQSQSIYFPDKKITVLNIENCNVVENLTFVKASLLHIPFKDNQFDFVVSNDTLEHIKKTDREKGIHEMIRVAKKGVIIGIPCDSTAQKYEQIVLSLGKKLGKSMKWLSEHKECKLPMSKEIMRIIKKNSKIKKISIEKNHNIHIWFLSCFLGPLTRYIGRYIKREKLVKYEKFFSLFNFGETYRKFFIIHLK